MSSADDGFEVDDIDPLSEAWWIGDEPEPEPVDGAVADWSDVPGLKPGHAELLAEHAITPQMAAEIGIRSAAERGEGIIVPYRWRRDGSRSLVYRSTDVERENGVPKYLWPKDRPGHLAQIIELDDGGPVAIVEGTLQVAAFASYAPPGWSVYGVNGARGWARDDLSFLRDRPVVAVFDHDVDTNRGVYDTAVTLAGVAAAMGARSVAYVRTPGGVHDGVDDLLGRVAPEARADVLTGLLDGATGELGPRPHSPEVRKELERLRARGEAQRIFDAERRPPRPHAGAIRLDALLDEPDEPVQWRIRGLLPTRGKALCTAQKKAGKTTLIGNLIRSLADGDAFLRGRRPEVGADPLDDIDPDVHPGFEVVALPEGRAVLLLDFEMTEIQLKTWLRDQRIRHPERVQLRLLRGTGPWDPRNDEVRAEWAAVLRDVGADVLIVDPLGPVLHGLGINENDNSEVGAFLAALDRLCADGGVSELVVAHHTGHEGERSRGASSMLGWPDAVWAMTRDGDSRFLSAEGRDVALGERVLTFDPATRRLGLGALDDRSTHRENRLAGTVAEIVAKDPGVSFRTLRVAVKDAAGCGTKAAEDAITSAVGQGVIHIHEGSRHAQLHYPGAACDGGCT